MKKNLLKPTDRNTEVATPYEGIETVKVNNKIDTVEPHIGHCCICGSPILYGNDAQPLENGRCCDLCNKFLVLPFRVFTQDKTDTFDKFMQGLKKDMYPFCTTAALVQAKDFPIKYEVPFRLLIMDALEKKYVSTDGAASSVGGEILRAELRILEEWEKNKNFYNIQCQNEYKYLVRRLNNWGDLRFVVYLEKAKKRIPYWKHLKSVTGWEELYSYDRFVDSKQYPYSRLYEKILYRLVYLDTFNMLINNIEFFSKKNKWDSALGKPIMNKTKTKSTDRNNAEVATPYEGIETVNVNNEIDTVENRINVTLEPTSAMGYNRTTNNYENN